MVTNNSALASSLALVPSMLLYVSVAFPNPTPPLEGPREDEALPQLI